MRKLCFKTAEEAVDSIRHGDLPVEEYVHSFLEQIEAVEGRLNSFITLLKEEALSRARELDKRISAGERIGRLAGLVVAVKDNICTRGIRTTCGSRMLENYIPPFDATVIRRLEQEDAIIIGKTNMDEFAMGNSTETSYFGPTRNPWDEERVPGGSSGGSAAAVAAGEATLALGSDTGGSVRCPASFCSIVGLKPTYGLVSRYGLIAYANSLEIIGPMGRTVYDCALLLTVIAGHDPYDSTSLPITPRDYTCHLNGDIEGLKVGVPKEFFGEGTEEAVAKAVWNAIAKLEELGASVEELPLPSLEYALPAYYLIAMSEASSNLARYDGVRYGYSEQHEGGWSLSYARTRAKGFGPEVKRRIILGTYALSAGYYDQYYLKALKVRTVVRQDFDHAFKKYEVLVGPTMPVLPFKIGEKIEDPLSLYMCDVDTVPANLAGIPAISIPCGFSQGLPVGMQIMAPRLREDLVLRVAYAFEQSTGYHKRRPSL